jgi:hypothetical protein
LLVKYIRHNGITITCFHMFVSWFSILLFGEQPYNNFYCAVEIYSYTQNESNNQIM